MMSLKTLEIQLMQVIKKLLEFLFYRNI